MHKIHFFDLPVYRLSPAEYSNDWEKQIAIERKRVAGQHNHAIPDRMDQSIRRDRHRRYGEWRYNEIIAYLRLHVFGTQLMADYCSAEKLRNPITRSKVFTERRGAITYKRNLGSQSQATNSGSWQTVQEFVQDCKKLKAGRFIDDSMLRRIGPHMDWLSIWRSG
jgi:hypothetical protein